MYTKFLIQITRNNYYEALGKKPPSSSAAGAKALRKASEKAGKPILVGFMKRYSIGNRIARNIIARGILARCWDCPDT
ncbi:MAG: hypothetical protein WBN04_09170, partial [Paracoccaceae bacterium]